MFRSVMHASILRVGLVIGLVLQAILVIRTFSVKEISIKPRFDESPKFNRIDEAPQSNAANPLDTIILQRTEKTLRINVESRVDPDLVKIYGISRKERSFLAIGIPCVARQRVSYLNETMHSLMTHASIEERQKTIIVILLADFGKQFVSEMTLMLDRYYKQYIDEGFIHVIHAPEWYYPDLENRKRNFNDPEVRVKWRSKQNIDYGMLMKYSAPLAEYYMQLEDDVVTVPNYIHQIQEFVDLHNRQTNTAKNRWVCLEFSPLGFIGKLFRSQDVEKIGKMLILFYDEQPGDLLLPYFIKMLTQSKPIHHKRSLFQHKGAYSSLQIKNKLKDPKVSEYVRKSQRGDNPAANLSTNIEMYGKHSLESVYNTSQDDIGLFWGKTSKVDDWILIRFHRPQRIRKMFIATGDDDHGSDVINGGVVEVAALKDENGVSQHLCGLYSSLGEFSAGVMTADDVTKLAAFDVSCIRIRMTKDHSNWIKIMELEVFVENGNRTV